MEPVHAPQKLRLISYYENLGSFWSRSDQNPVLNKSRFTISKSTIIDDIQKGMRKSSGTTQNPVVFLGATPYQPAPHQLIISEPGSLRSWLLFLNQALGHRALESSV